MSSTQSFERVVSRGQTYYIHKTPAYEGSREIHPKSGRPGIIVSRDTDNYMSGTVMVVYLTSGNKQKVVRETQYSLPVGKLARSVVKCEQIDTVDKNCIGDYICDISQEDMAQIEERIFKALDILPDSFHKNMDSLKYTISGLESANEALREQIRDLEESKSKKSDNTELKTAKEEAEMYKRMYKDMLGALAGRAF